MDRGSDTHFLNVDLDIYSHNDLQSLVDRFGRKVQVLFAGRERRRFSAHLEVARQTATADATIRAFCRLVNNLPVSERRLWDAAIVRSFSVGVQAEISSPVRDFRLSPETITAVSGVKAEIILTVYAPAQKRRGK